MTLPRRTLLFGAVLPLAARAAESGDTLLCPLAEPPDVLVPGVSDSIGTRLIGSNLYRGLTRLTADGTPTPDLAGWTVSPDRLRLQFHLQPHLLWHDGTPITAADVVFSLDRLHRARNPRLDLTRVTSIAAEDAQSVLITLSEPFEPMLAQLDVLSAAIVPQHVHDTPRWGLDPATTMPVGAGPFRWDGWLRLTRASAGSVGATTGALSAAVFPILPKLADRVAAVRRGRPSLLLEPLMDGQSLAVLRADTTLVVEPVVPAGARPVALLWLNAARPPLDNAAVRQALAAAIDCGALIWAVWNGFATLPGSHPAYDPQAAAAQLQAAGLRPGDDGLRAQLHLLQPPGMAPARLAAALTHMLGLIAVDLLTSTPDLPEWGRRLTTGDYDLALDLRERPPPDGDAILLAQPSLALARDGRLHLPNGVYGGFAGATLA